MFTSSANVFRIRQVVCDLVVAVGMHREALQRLGITGSDRESITRITADGRIDPEAHRNTVSNLLLAAAMPDEDFASFVGATLVLLSDKLQGGDGEDDLANNWLAFRQHYLLCDPPVRAALMNGFRLAENLGLVALKSPPEDQECMTYSRGDVVTTVQSVGLHELGVAIRKNALANEVGAMWQHTSEDQKSWQLLMGFRYLFERAESLQPPVPQEAALIPWV
ncbi:MAG: hypothetical protein AAGF55_07735 [Pseudomonadota bacterium]